MLWPVGVAIRASMSVMREDRVENSTCICCTLFKICESVSLSDSSVFLQPCRWSLLLSVLFLLCLCLFESERDDERCRFRLGEGDSGMLIDLKGKRREEAKLTYLLWASTKKKAVGATLSQRTYSHASHMTLLFYFLFYTGSVELWANALGKASLTICFPIYFSLRLLI